MAQGGSFTVILKFPKQGVPTMPLTTDQKMLILSHNVIEAFAKADPDERCTGIVLCGVCFPFHECGRREPLRSISLTAGCGQRISGRRSGRCANAELPFR